jgi:hypothetical protein
MATKRPLLNTAADQRLFVFDEASRRRAYQAAFTRRNTLIVGEPGSGKTSLLYQIFANVTQSVGSVPAILLDARLASESRVLVDMLLERAQEEGWVEERMPPNADDPFGLARQVRRLRDAPTDAIVLIDDPTDEQARTLFGQLRDELWQTPLWFCVAVGEDVMQSLSRPPADAFFDVAVTLEPLGGEDAEELLRRRKHAGEMTAPVERPEHPLQPRALVAIAAGDAPARRYDPRLQHRLLQKAELIAGRAGAMLLAEMWARDAVSASDSDLQRSLGVTRNRLTELLRSLAAADVLVATPESAEGRVGRPKMLYSVRDQ